MCCASNRRLLILVLSEWKGEWCRALPECSSTSNVRLAHTRVNGCRLLSFGDGGDDSIVDAINGRPACGAMFLLIVDSMCLGTSTVNTKICAT